MATSNELEEAKLDKYPQQEANDEEKVVTAANNGSLLVHSHSSNQISCPQPLTVDMLMVEPPVIVKTPPPLPMAENKVGMMTDLGDWPRRVQCPSCHQDVTTVVEHKVGTITWVAFGVTALFCCW